MHRCHRSPTASKIPSLDYKHYDVSTVTVSTRDAQCCIKGDTTRTKNSPVDELVPATQDGTA